MAGVIEQKSKFSASKEYKMKKSEKKDQIQSAYEKKKLQRKRGILIAIYLFILILVLIGVILLMLSSNYKDEISLILIISGYIVLTVSILLVTILIILKPMKNIKNKISTLEVNEILERMKEKKKWEVLHH